MRRPKRFGFVCSSLFLAMLAGLSPLAAETLPSVAKVAAKSFPDNADLRGKLFAYVIGASRDVALAYGEKQMQSAAGPVTVRVEKRSADFIVEFLNASPSGDAGRGSCFIQRGNAKGNYILQARILLEDDPSCFLCLYPSGSGTRGDIIMYGAVVKKGLFFSDMIYRILLLSFSDIVESTSRSFDWSGVLRLGTRGDEGDFAAELRSALASAPAAEEQAAPSAASIAINSATSKVALAAAPALPSPGGLDAIPMESRPLSMASAIDRAATPESLAFDLTASGYTGAHELSIAADSAPAFVDDRVDPLVKPVYVAFPRYDAKGLPFTAIRAAIYLDLLSNPGSVYALMGEGFRATIVPSFSETGRIEFAVFTHGEESSWDELSADRRDLKARVVRVLP